MNRCAACLPHNTGGNLVLHVESFTMSAWFSSPGFSCCRQEGTQVAAGTDHALAVSRLWATFMAFCQKGKW